MTDTGETPEELREEVEQDLDELAKEAAEEERARIAQRKDDEASDSA